MAADEDLPVAPMPPQFAVKPEYARSGQGTPIGGGFSDAVPEPAANQGQSTGAPLPIPEPVGAPSPIVAPATGALPTAGNGTAVSTMSNGIEPQPDSGYSTCPQRCYRNGCCHDLDCSEVPFGTCARAAACAQICSGTKARMVLYQYDFCDAAACDGYKLSVKGLARLADIARMLPATDFHPITIEASFQNPQLDARRRAYVLLVLNQLNIPVPEQVVVVGPPPTPGFNGQESLLLQLSVLRQLQNGGSSIAAGSGGYGSSMNASSGGNMTSNSSGGNGNGGN
jgi:hypothetical protein